MQEFNFNQHITQLLKADNRLVDEENDIQINVLRDLVNNLDSQLIELLIADEKVREKFFIQVKDVYVFKQNDFIFYLDSKVLDGSYTQYANRIGLASGGKFLTDSTDYVLDFPYKDCVLEGGQSTEEGNDVYFEFDDDANDYVEKSAKRKEIFYNNIIAKDEIDRLLEPKAFQKVVRYDANGETIPTSFTRDAELNRQRGLPEDTITDNLIIKGNNLLALHSLEKEFKGKVKLIYIDPPYNTGSDSFKYNDNFNHSTWLTFMYNRLFVANKLLRNDGVLFISCDDNEFGYLNILLDNFKDLYFESAFYIKVRHENRILRKDNRYQKVMEQLICYGKEQYNPSRIEVTKDKDLDYIFEIELLDTPKEIINIQGYNVEVFSKDQYKIIKSESGNLKEYNIRGSLITQKGSASEFYELNLRDRKHKDGLGALYKVIDMGTRGDGIGYRYIRQPFDETGQNGFYYQGKPLKSGEDIGNPYPNFYDFEKNFNNSSNEGGVNFKNGKKPELFLEKIFEISSIGKNDIVLDYHLGSGSTAAISHKHTLQYIGIEQLDSQISLTIQRLKNVINGDQSGISESVNWQGGGSFVYAELAKNNETAKERIEACDSLEELLQLFEELNTRYFLDYNVRIKDFKENVVKEEAFINLSIARQKVIFKRMLDNNQLYVNLSEVEDARYNLSEDAIRLTKDFYQIKN
ncbi:DNA methyltransferase [Empedobacter brevis]|uniref:DNA methyltransferase n=1 Tax=Empedobacter brevis TaxID=247 RepID=UPI0039AEDB42